MRVLQYQSGMDLERRNTRKRDLKLAMLIIKFINKIEAIFFILINIHVCVAIFFFSSDARYSIVKLFVLIQWKKKSPRM